VRKLFSRGLSIILHAPLRGVERHRETDRRFRMEFGEHNEYELIPNTREHKYDFYPFG